MQKPDRDDTSKMYLPVDHEKKRFVRDMFDSVAPRYDFLNRLLSGFVDVYWRIQALKLINFKMNPRVLDLATGTGDVALQAIKRGARQVIGVDLSYQMLVHGKKKTTKRGLNGHIHMICGEAENLPLRNASMDAVTIAFGIRNVSDVNRSLAEMARVLEPSGVAVILEFSQPTLLGFKQLYRFYFLRVLPVIGSVLSKDKKAYHYLPHSVLQFPERKQFAQLMETAGFSNVRFFDMTFGIVTVYCGIK